MRKLSLKRPSDPEVWYWLAEVQGLDQNIIGLHLSRAEYFYLTGSYETSIKHLRMALELTGNNFQLTESIHNRIERSHKSIESLKSVSSRAAKKILVQLLDEYEDEKLFAELLHHY